MGKLHERRLGRGSAPLDDLAAQEIPQVYDEVLPMTCNGGFTAGSSPSRMAGKVILQGFFGKNVVTRNEGVRGSSPRVGFSGRENPCIPGFCVVSEDAKSASL